MREVTGNTMMPSNAGFDRRTDCLGSRDAVPSLTETESLQVFEELFAVLSDFWDCDEGQHAGVAGTSESMEKNNDEIQ